MEETKTPKYGLSLRVVIPAIIAIIGLLSYFYYTTNNSQYQTLNRHYLRELGDATKTFNTRLNQYYATRWYTQASAAELDNNAPVCVVHDNPQADKATGKIFYFESGKFVYRDLATQECWQQPITNFLPAPSGEFSQYLLVTPNNKVLATKGDLRALSVIDTRQIARQIALELNRDWVKLAANFEKNSSVEQQAENKLPGFSYYLDLKLNPGEYRIYLFPFSVDLDFPVTPRENAHQLYLLGIVPKSALSSTDSKRWTLSNYVLSLLAVVFFLVITRLFLLSQHQPVDNLFYHTTLYSSFIFFAAITAAYFAFFETSLEKADKARKAFAIAQSTSRQMFEELKQTLPELDRIAQFYMRDTFSCDTGVCKRDPETNPAALALSNWDTNSLICDSDKTKTGSDPVKPDPVCVYFSKEIRQKAECSKGHVTGVETRSTLVNCQWREAMGSMDWHILHAFTLKDDGMQAGNQFYNKEFQRRPQNLDLSHREYFKTILNQEGWYHAALTKGLTFQQFYIQRLRSLTNGSLATTLSVPLLVPGANYKVLAADIELRSVSQFSTERLRDLQDISLFVLDRASGEILFHTDRSRILNENLFSNGRETDAVRHAIQARRDSREGRVLAISGNYQGLPGWFVVHEAPLDQWAVVTFFPRESLNNYFSNIFFINIVYFLAFLLLGQSIAWSMSAVNRRSPVRRVFGIPKFIESRKLMLFLSVLIFAQIGSTWIGFGLTQHFSAPEMVSIALVIIANLIVITWGISSYAIMAEQQMNKPRDIKHRMQDLPRLVAQHFDWGCAWLLVGFVVGAVFLNWNLHYSAKQPARALNWYYKNTTTPRINAEVQNLVAKARQLYPSSIRGHGQDPFKLMEANRSSAIDSALDRLQNNSIGLDDVGSFSEFTQLTNTQEWLDRYIFRSHSRNRNSTDSLASAQTADDTSERGLQSVNSDTESGSHSTFYFFLFVVPFGAFMLAWLWISFNKRILYGRLFGTENMLRFINRLYRHNIHNHGLSPDSNLQICLPRTTESGVPLTYLLTSETPQRRLLKTLFCDNAALSSLFNDPSPCPNIELRLTTTRQGVEIAIFNITANLNTRAQRDKLLWFFQRMKELKRVEKINKLTLFCSYESIVMLLSINNLRKGSDISTNLISTEEYNDWAYCLRDFTVTTEIERSYLDRDFIAKETDAMPALKNFISFADTNLSEVKSGAQLQYNDYRWTNLPDRFKTSTEWYSIRYIQLKAGAFYRTLWNSCAPSEKLALFYLAKHKRINPNNEKVLENLATRGLVQVYRGQVRIVNQSFASYILHAESTDTLHLLIRQGDMGNWNDYRMAVYLVVAAVLFALTLWSGNSLYVIISSALGFMALVSNIVSGVSFLRGRLLG
ncbi:cache domain-containing protein [Teredinibacter turnerae]|uniref:cache domain-containing protein n=1 Tax=Teredinibacter turnerae TaxID=2426 RepID=UPI0003FA0714|nr:cache domain-containing protein [Teredinibacter turnerae]